MLKKESKGAAPPNQEINKARHVARRVRSGATLTLDAAVRHERKMRPEMIQLGIIIAESNFSSFLFWLGDPATIDDQNKHEIVRGVAANFVKHGKPLPEPLRSYVVSVLCEPLPPSSQTMRRGGRHVRDMAIVSALTEVAADTRLAPTRNRAQRDDGKKIQSVCSIVTEVIQELKINLSEDAVEKLWSANRKEIESRVILARRWREQLQ